MSRNTLTPPKGVRYRDAAEIADHTRGTTPMNDVPDGITAPPELFERLRGTLDGGTDSLNEVAASQPPGINAGESTPPVAETLGKLLEASAGVLAGTQEMAADVQATRDTYLNNDGAAAGLFRRHGQ